MTIENQQRCKYVIADLITSAIAIVLFNVIRHQWFVNNKTGFDLPGFLTHGPVLTGELIFPLLMIAIAYLSGAYYNVTSRSRVDELTNTILTTGITSIIIFSSILIDDISDDKRTVYEMMATLWLMLFIPMESMRVILSTRHKRRARCKSPGNNTLIVGVTQAAINMAEKLRNSPNFNDYNIVGYVNPTADAPISQPDLPVYNLSELNNIAEEQNIVHLIVMPHRDGMHATINLINRLFPLGCSIFISPTLFHVISGKSHIGNVAGEPFIDVSHPDIRPSTACCKRAADLIVSALSLIMLSPLMGAIAIALKIKQGGAIFYKQERVGYRKKIFRIIKFRTMLDNAEDNGPALSSPDDPRVTPLGRMLRKYRLDELPQFWNVIKGEMSIVGPRPEREYYIRQIISEVPYYTLIHNVRPGITSWGMVKYGYATTVDEMVERLKYDLVYIENISFGVDLKIILYTIRTVLTGRGV